jgi:hypothetical protein
MTELVASVNQVSRIIGEIAAATKEQSAGIAQVNVAVADLDKATQQNASLVEESTAASESLKELAREMVDAVSVFQLAGRAPSSARQAQGTTGASRVIAERKVTALPRKSRPAGEPALPLAAQGNEVWKEF